MVKTRTVTQVLLFKLVLNPMQANTETAEIAAWSDDEEKLMKFYKEELVEPYREEGSPSFIAHGSSHEWVKSFRKGGPLEWYNPLYNLDGDINHWGHGIHTEWVDQIIIDNISTEAGHRVQ